MAEYIFIRKSVVLHLHEGPELRTRCWWKREEKWFGPFQLRGSHDIFTSESQIKIESFSLQACNAKAIFSGTKESEKSKPISYQWLINLPIMNVLQLKLIMLNFIDFYHWIGGAKMILCKEAWSGRGLGLVHSFIKMVSFLNFADVWIRTVDLWCWKRTLNQLSHNHCRTKWFLLSQVQGGRMKPHMTICAPALPNIVEKYPIRGISKEIRV